MPESNDLPIILPVRYFDINWQFPPTLSSDYDVQIDRNVDGSEQRKLMASKPKRVQTLQGLTLEQGNPAQVRLFIESMTDSRPQTPLFCDETTLTADAILGTSILNCDPSNRRFFAGSKLVIVHWETNKVATVKQVLTVNTVLSASIQTDETLALTYLKGDSIYPLFTADAKFSHDYGDVATDKAVRFDIQLEEYVGTTAISPYVTPGTLPPGEIVYRGLPVFEIPHSWTATRQGMKRYGRSNTVGQGVVLSPATNRAIDTGQLDFVQTDRALAKRLTAFWDSRGGSTYTFWYPLPTHDFIVLEKISDTNWQIRSPVEDIVSPENQMIAFWKRDGSVQVVHVDLSVSLGDVYTITLDDDVTESADQILRVSWATLARFSGSYVEQWPSSAAMRSRLSIQGLLWSGDATCSGECCEIGNCCNPLDCPDPPPPDDPDDPPLPPWDPIPACEAGTAPAVPYYYDVSGGIWSKHREPIRAADFQASPTCVIEIKPTFVFDSNHPHGSDLSDELKHVLYANHELLFSGTIARTANSRNPYHLAVNGGTTHAYAVRAGGELVDASPFWELEVDYTIDPGGPGEEDHVLTLRLYAEWVDQTAGGGDTDFGMFGTAWVLWVRSTEIVPGYVDGTPYAPFDNVSFTADDPFVGGLYEGLPVANKYMHPQTLFVGMAPTSWHSPVGYDWHSEQDRNQFLHECFAELNGAPWSTGIPDDAIDNSVFGYDANGARLRALGALGGWTASEFFEHIALENGAGTGMTLLRPTRPGWTEATGELVIGAADVEIQFCTPTQPAIDACAGHPLDPVDSNGGTHDCFRMNYIAGALDPLCYPTETSTVLTLKEVCESDSATYDSDCCIEDSECSSSFYVTSFGEVLPEEWHFAYRRSQTLREIIFKQYEDNPDYVRKTFPQSDFCDLPSPFSDWDLEIGQTAIPSKQDCPGAGTADVSLLANSGRSTINGQYAYSTISPVEDGTIGAILKFRAGQRAGLGFRTVDDTVSQIAGYFGILDRVAEKLIIYKSTGVDAWAVVTDLDVSLLIQDIDYGLSLKALGHTITFAAIGLGSITIVDCDFQFGGDPALVILNAAQTDVFEQIVITDDNWQKYEIEISVTNKSLILVDMVPTMGKGYQIGVLLNQCNTCIPADCPSDDCFGTILTGCPCTSVCKGVSGQYSMSSLNYPSGETEPHNVPGEWHPPSDVGGCGQLVCSPPVPSCSPCPPPYKYLSWNSSHCKGEGQNSTNIWLGGLSGWTWVITVCA